jgi:coenzyme PQQ precursor peptide PqqA
MVTSMELKSICHEVALTLRLGWRAVPQGKELIMAWTTPILIEICMSLEINGYLPAEL